MTDQPIYTRTTRPPTQEELSDLLATTLSTYSELPTPEEESEVLGHIAGSAICVCEDYITDGPGFTGPVMIVLWPAGWTEVFRWTPATPGLEILESVYRGEGA
jgi:hypothetical protein